ncbi:MAG TPA: efflux RND transporter periplasmic adaptor subunit [Pseudacidobacterium sp.]|nr:efflux RND transporter periplasmic adaptor subunit [Pseudacidobacterium sp.]
MTQQPPSASVVSPEPQPPSQTPASTRKPRRLWVWAVILLLFGLLFYWVIRQHNQAQSAGGGRRGMTGPVSVIPATAKQGNIGVYLDAIGTVTPVYTASMTAQVTGVVTAVHYREGQYVHKGESLIDLDARPYEAQLIQAQGALARDQAILAAAQMDLERYRQAWAHNAIPRQTLEDQEKTVLQAQGTVKNDEGLVKYSQLQVDYCHIISPITGRVGLRLVDPGNLVTANGTTSLVVVTQSQPITIIFTLSEENLSPVLEQMRHGNKLTVEAWDRELDKQLAVGKLSTVDNQIDTTTGTVKLRAAFDNKDNILFPNQFVNTRLLVTTLENQVLIPSSAIQRNGDVAFVYLIQNGKAVMHTVKPGIAEKGVTAVQGLQPGDVVADSSFERLQNGASIVISKMTLPSTSQVSGESAP